MPRKETSKSQSQIVLKLSESSLDLESLVEQLRQREDELKKTIEKIEKSQHVPQELLDLEVSV